MPDTPEEIRKRRQEHAARIRQKKLDSPPDQIRGAMVATAEESLTREIALKDWLRVPTSDIAQIMGVTVTTIRNHRLTPLYTEVTNELRADWQEKVASSPATRDLRRDISYGMGAAVHRIIRIVSSPKSRDGDAISAAKLLAQMDGRFLTDHEEGDHAEHPADKTESLAAELLKAMGKDVIQ